MYFGGKFAGTKNTLASATGEGPSDQYLRQVFVAMMQAAKTRMGEARPPGGVPGGTNGNGLWKATAKLLVSKEDRLSARGTGQG